MDGRSEGYSTVCLQNNPCDSIGQYVKSVDKINGAVCACMNGYFPEPSDLSDPCKLCYCCDAQNTSLEQGCLTNMVEGAFCRHGVGLSHCEGTLTPTWTTRVVTTHTTTIRSKTTVMSTSLQPPSKMKFIVLIQYNLVSCCYLDNFLDGILKSGNQTKKIILIIVLPIVFIIMIAIAVVCKSPSYEIWMFCKGSQGVDCF
jgi:hypothetical protein